VRTGPIEQVRFHLELVDFFRSLRQSAFLPADD
jgi:hypothetical protein